MKKIANVDDLQKLLDQEQPQLTKQFVQGMLNNNLDTNPNFNGKVRGTDNTQDSRKLAGSFLSKDVLGAFAPGIEQEGTLKDKQKKSKRNKDPSVRALGLLQESMKNNASKSKFKDKMAKVIADGQGEEAIVGQPGKKVYLSW